MKRLLAIELQKIWKNKASRALTITYFVLLSTIALVSAMKFNIGFFALKPAEMGIFNFPFIWHFTTYIAGVCVGGCLCADVCVGGCVRGRGLTIETPHPAPR